MTISRSVPTRMAEAVHALVVADADLLALVGSNAQQIRLSHPTIEESSVAAPQINVALVPTVGWKYWLGEVSELTWAIRVTHWVSTASISGGRLTAGAINGPIDVLLHIVSLVAQSANGMGRLEDPDAAPGAEGVDLYLNHVFGTPQWGVERSKDGSAIGYYVDLIFESRIDNTGARA